MCSIIEVSGVPGPKTPDTPALTSPSCPRRPIASRRPCIRVIRVTKGERMPGCRAILVPVIEPYVDLRQSDICLLQCPDTGDESHIRPNGNDIGYVENQIKLIVRERRFRIRLVPIRRQKTTPYIWVTRLRLRRRSPSVDENIVRGR